DSEHEPVLAREPAPPAPRACRADRRDAHRRTGMLTGRHALASRVAPKGARSARDKSALASLSFTKRSALASQVSGRASFIAIQLAMQAVPLRWATAAGASGVWRERTASSQLAWCEVLCGSSTFTPLGSSRFSLLAASGGNASPFADWLPEVRGSLAVVCPSR